MSKFFTIAFAQSGHRCIYCGRDLVADFDAFMLAEEDHLVPRSKGGADSQENIVIACAICNRLKGKWVPDTQFDPEKRNDYIIAIRHFIMGERARLMDTFAGWVCLPKPGA